MINNLVVIANLILIMQYCISFPIDFLKMLKQVLQDLNKVTEYCFLGSHRQKNSTVYYLFFMVITNINSFCIIDAKCQLSIFTIDAL